MSATTDALERLRSRTDTLNAAYTNQVGSAITTYGKVASDVFNRSVARTTQLLQKRQTEEGALLRDRERFQQATSMVLSDKTLEWLRSLSNIAAPTLTSVFAGYESARADEAKRMENLLNQRETALVRMQADQQLAVREGNNIDSQLLTSQGNLLNATNSMADRALSTQLGYDKFATEAAITTDREQQQQAFALKKEEIDSGNAIELAYLNNDLRTAEAELNRAYERELGNTKSAAEIDRLNRDHTFRMERIREQAKYSPASQKKQQKTLDFIRSLPMGNTTPASSMTTPSTTDNSIASFIGRAESGGTAGRYGAVNRGRAGDSGNESIDYSKMTFSELMRRQQLDKNDPDYAFAAGRFQIVPKTMKESIAKLGISPDTPVTNELQDRIFADYLLKDKRPRFRDYIQGTSNDLNGALEDGALEFASIKRPSGVGAHDKVGGNNATLSANDFAGYINQARTTYQSLLGSGVDEVTAYRRALGINLSSPTNVPAPTTVAPSSSALPPTAPPLPPQSANPIEQTLAEFQGSPDVVDSIREAAIAQAQQDPDLVGQLGENPTLDELAVVATKTKDERLKQLLEAGLAYQRNLEDAA